MTHSKADILRGGPGLRGYAFRAAMHCENCTREIVAALDKDSFDEMEFNDSEVVPQPAFFPESDIAEHCDTCGEYLYGPKRHCDDALVADCDCDCGWHPGDDTGHESDCASRNPKRHWHWGAGLHGYLYQDGPHFAESYRDAVESLAESYDLGRTRKAKLRRDGYLELNLKRDGNEYCEITECQENCDGKDFE